MRAAVLQLFATPFDRERNLATAARLARAAVDQGAQLLVLPELFNTGYVYTPRLTQAAEPDDGPTIAWLRAQSAALGAHLAGTLLLRQAGRVRNAFVLAAPDGTVHTYYKRHPFLWEHCYFEPGAQPLIAETALGRLGLLVCWDVVQPAAWATYAGQVDAVLVASTPARFHRAVLNFPGAQKVYLAQLMPALLRQRAALDGLHSTHIAACAAALGVPVAHAVMAGRFVTQLPLPRFSLLCAAWRKPRYWPLARQAPLASLRATFYGGSALYDARGAVLAEVAGEEGSAVADLPAGPRSSSVSGASGAGEARAAPRPRLPAELTLFERLLRPLAAGVYRRYKVA
jgi:predicted amidohydrolase